jgi:hypothetical protein
MLPKFHSAAPVPNPRCSPRLLLVTPPLLLAASPFLVTAPGAAFPTHRVGAPPGCSLHRGRCSCSPRRVASLLARLVGAPSGSSRGHGAKDLGQAARRVGWSPFLLTVSHPSCSLSGSSSVVTLPARLRPLVRLRFAFYLF